jgi:hypothetical protein
MVKKMSITIDDLNVYDSQETVSIGTDSEFREWISQFYDNDEEIDEAIDRCRTISVIDMINGVGDSWKYFTGQCETTIYERVEWIESNSDNPNINVMDIVNEYLRAHCPEYDFNHVEDE